MNIEESKQLEITGLRSIPLLKYLKYPAFLKEELYERYPSGGEFGWYAYVEELKGFACWSTELEDWIVGTGTGGSVFDKHNTTLTGVTSIATIKLNEWTVTHDAEQLLFKNTNLFDNRNIKFTKTVISGSSYPAIHVNGLVTATRLFGEQIDIGYWSIHPDGDNLQVYTPTNNNEVIINLNGITNVGDLKANSWLFSESLNGDLLITSINQRDIVMSGVRLTDLAFGSYTINRVNNELKIKFDDVDLIVMDESGQVRIPNLVTT